MSNFMRQRIPDRRSGVENERCPNVLLFMCGMRRVLESEEEQSCLDGEGQTDKQRLYQRKRSDRVLTTHIRYMLLWAASD